MEESKSKQAAGLGYCLWPPQVTKVEDLGYLEDSKCRFSDILFFWLLEFEFPFFAIYSDLNTFYDTQLQES